MATDFSNDFILAKNEYEIYDISLSENGDFATDNFLDTSLLRSIYGERRALPNEMIVPELRRGWIGNLFSDYEDGSKVWLYEQSRINRDTLNGVKREIENGLLWLIDFKVAIGYSVDILLDDELSMTAAISIQRSTSKTINRFYTVFDNSGVTK